MSRHAPVQDGDFVSITEGIDYLRSIGMGNVADAIERTAIRDERARDRWTMCNCGARTPSRCLVCSGGAIEGCICVEFNQWSKR